MAKIIKPEQESTPPVEAWRTEGETYLIIALDKNEAVAVRNAVREYRNRCGLGTHAGSLNGAGGRVYEALAPATKGLH